MNCWVSILLFIGCLILSISARARDDSDAKQDSIACGELRQEYIRVCTGHSSGVRAKKDDDFCDAFENICFSIPKGEPDKASEPVSPMKARHVSHSDDEEDSEKDDESETVTEAPKATKKRISKKSFAKFCKEFKNRYLYVCPDPFRFGQKAIVFCPVYSEKCQVPLPDHPVVPKKKSSRKRSGGSIDAICRSYQGFAMNYCNNPFLTSQAQYRDACDKYWRFCGKYHQQGR